MDSYRSNSGGYPPQQQYSHRSGGSAAAGGAGYGAGAADVDLQGGRLASAGASVLSARSKAATPAAGSAVGGGAGGASGGGGAQAAIMGDMLELEHVIGYTGRAAHNIHCHPQRVTEFVCSLGANVVIGDIDDPHQQEFLRAHDEEITALVMSRSGVLIASGQQGSTRSPELVAPVVVWDYERRAQVFNLFGITQAVTAVAFSPDDQFLAATGADNMLFVWDMQTGEQLVGKKYSHPVTFITWAPVLDNGRRPVYRLNMASNQVTWINTLQYEVKSMRYAMKSEAYALPSSGLLRDYLVGFCCGEFLLGGTASGELTVFNMTSKVYRASVRVSSNGVVSIAGTGDNTVYCGSGDGHLQVFQGADSQWKCVADTMLQGRIVAMSMSADQTFVLAGTSAGRVYRVNIGAKLEALDLKEAHTAKVTCVCFGAKRSDVFCTGASDGSIRIWDLSDYRVLQDATGPCGVTCVALDGPYILAGFEDGVLRYYDAATGAKCWSIRAHRGHVTSVAVNEMCIISGGADNKVALWSRRSREQLMQFNEHIKPVVSVMADVVNPKLVHSAGADRCTFTYDLQKERRVVGHQVPRGAVGVFTCMSQRADSEQELVTAGTDGKVLYWDCDVEKPVMVIQDPAKVCINDISVSPSGRFFALCGDDHHVKVFDTVRGTLVAANLGHSARVAALRWSPDEKQIVSVGADCCICVWNWYGME